MKIFYEIVLLTIITLLSSCTQTDFQNGDIIFQVSKSKQSIAIQKATHSQYSHMGIIYIHNGNEFVYEAASTVKSTPLNQWIARGENQHYVVKRLKDWKNVLTDENLLKLKESGDQFINKPYDIKFDWSDDKLYCSELVWKIYHRALGYEIGELKTFGDFDLSSPEVLQIMKQRYSEGLPLDMPVISPADMYNSDLLIKVKEE